jgi:hypothetical protein
MVTMTTTMARAPRATAAAAASPSSRASSAPMRATNAPRARASFASFASVSAKVRASTTTTTRAVDDDDDGRSRQDYVKPVQQESALLESETFSAALTAAFVVFLLAGAFFVFGQLAKPVLDVMVQSFPGGSK